MKKFIVLFLLVLFSTPSQAEDGKLKAELENVITNVRQAIETKDFEKYQSLFTPYEKASTKLEKDVWLKHASEPYKNITLSKAPDVSKTTYLKTLEKAPYAFYYYADESSPNDIGIGALVFKKVNNSWTLYGRNAISTKQKSEFKTKDDMLKFIDTDPTFNPTQLLN